MSKRIRCAIYTRKSTEDGLEQDFNSLDAQREACEAFIQSQRGLGWVVQKKHYDDGGISGGTMERPALASLIVDIEKNKIDLVVVYKVDRLTRSLMDFAKIIETFDERGVSFVSVTQQFNTANSMGRLTLNVLLSFAQFEREVTAERIRDKIAASKKKGMWMGGQVPLGYDTVDKKLIINEPEAKTVKTLFQLYMEKKSVSQVLEAAGHQNIATKQRNYKNGVSGGIPFSRGHIYQLLRNPLYVGDIRHKDMCYTGQHDAIIERSLWDAVQYSLSEQSPLRHSRTNIDQACLFTGILFDETGDRLSPTYAKKGHRRYRYYISKRLVTNPEYKENTWRLPALKLERTILSKIIRFLNDEQQWMRAVDLSKTTPEEYKRLRRKVIILEMQLHKKEADQIQKTVKQILKRITVQPANIDIVFNNGWYSDDGNDLLANKTKTEYELSLPFHIRRRGVESKITIGNENKSYQNPDQYLIEVVRRSNEWWQWLTSDAVNSVKAVAERASVDASDVTRYLPLAFLAPDIIEAIFDGKQPIDLNIEHIKKISPIPANWNEQRKILGFAN